MTQAFTWILTFSRMFIKRNDSPVHMKSTFFFLFLVAQEPAWLRCPRWISSQLPALPCRTIPPARALLCPTLFKCRLTLTPPYLTLPASAQNRCSTVGTWVAFGLIIKTQSRNLLSLEAGALFFFPPVKHKELFSFKMAAVSPLPSATLMLSHV